MEKDYGIVVTLLLRVTTKIASLGFLSKTLFLLLLLSIHGVLTWVNRDFTWLAAFGGLLTVLGVLLIFHYSLPENESREFNPKETIKYRDGRYVLEPENGGFASIIPEEFAKQLIEQQKQQATDHASYITEKRKRLASYLIFTVSGTLLWAYIGFLNFLFKST